MTAPPVRIGLYGGTFDPVHNGHLILAREALEQLGLDRVVFIPAALSPHKTGTPPTPAATRWELLRTALDGEPGFAAADRELSRDGPSFSIETVEAYAESHPAARLFYLIGDDNIAALHTWKEIERLRRLAEFVVLSRSRVGPIEGFRFVTRRVDISSTDIRNRIARGLSVRYLVPDSVCQAIQRMKLYRSRND